MARSDSHGDIRAQLVRKRRQLRWHGCGWKVGLSMGVVTLVKESCKLKPEATGQIAVDDIGIDK